MHELYDVHLSQRTKKFLDKLEHTTKDQIVDRLKMLAQKSVPSDAKFIGRDDTGNKVFRLRISDYRALYIIKDPEKVVLITKVDKRPRIYHR